MGREGTHRRLAVRPTAAESGPALPVVWFNGADAELPAGAIDLVYTLNINEYKGERTLQLMYVDSRPAQAPEVVVSAAAPGRGRVVHDRRGQLLAPADLPSPDKAVWYAEGALLASEEHAVAYAPRTALLAPRPSPLAPLVIWSTPPSSELLNWLLETSAASEIYLCAQRTADDAPATVVQQVAGMCKFALGRDGIVDVGRMAARLGTTEAVIRTSLLLLESRGKVRLVEWLEGDRVRLAPGDNRAVDDAAGALYADLETQLAEVRAYRQFFRRARIEELGVE